MADGRGDGLEQPMAGELRLAFGRAGAGLELGQQAGIAVDDTGVSEIEQPSSLRPL
jgi:hypothetical protein